MSDNIRVINLNKGEVLASSGNDTEFIYYIIGGTLKAYTSFAEFIYGPGEIVGTTDAYYGINSHTYVAETDCAIEAYPFNTMSDLSKVFSEHKPELAGIVIKNNAHMLELIKCYLSLMMKCRFKDSSYSSGAHVNRWELDKYNSISSVPSDVMTAYFLPAQLSMSPKWQKVQDLQVQLMMPVLKWLIFLELIWIISRKSRKKRLPYQWLRLIFLRGYRS